MRWIVPYIKNNDLKNLLRNAFDYGFISALAMDHEENTPEFQKSIDFKKCFSEIEESIKNYVSR
jgi:hypothetical protein